MPFEQSDWCPISENIAEIHYVYTGILKFALLQCSNALSQLSNLCLSLPNYNLSHWQ